MQETPVVRSNVHVHEYMHATENYKKDFEILEFGTSYNTTLLFLKHEERIPPFPKLEMLRCVFRFFSLVQHHVIFPFRGNIILRF